MIFEKKPVPGYENEYYLDPERMQVVNRKTGRPLKPRPDSAGYAEVKLYKNNKGTHKTLHRLFAESYIPNPDDLPCINHRDENPMNYSLDNLEWCTQSYNQRYGTVNERRGPKISEATKGVSRPWMQGHPGYNSIAIYAVDGWGNETYYPSAKAAAQDLGLDRATVTAVLRGRRKSTGGYRFYYA